MNPIARLLLAGLGAYKVVVSPWLPRACRYHPTCSEYARDAIRQRGVLAGVVLSVWRLLRCNPLSSGGFDPVE